MSKANKQKEFLEEIIIKNSSVAKCYIEDYGPDGERKDRLYKTTRGKMLRLFCMDCPEVGTCHGWDWNKCENRIKLLTIINIELAKQNKLLKEDLKRYKHILGEEEDLEDTNSK